MDKEAKSRVAQFRFGVIHDLIGDRKLARGERQRLLKEKSACAWEIPYSERTFISSSTILAWVRRYEKGGRRLESLYPEVRRDRGRSRALDEETLRSLIELKKQLRGASVPIILREARLRKILHPGIQVHPVTIYRLFRERGLMNRQEVADDRRRFEAELPNDIWQSDCMHGPRVLVDGKSRKSYLFAFIDDMSRMIPHAAFYQNERVDTYAGALRIALAKRGLPRKLYVDNGPAFRSHLLGHATAALGIALIHSKPYQPQGRGKIERFFRTVRMQFLPTCSEEMTLAQLNGKLTKWIDEEYHATVHSSTHQTPLARYLKHVHLIREAPKDLHDYFRIHVVRKVDRDRTVSLGGRLYEAPVCLIGKTLTLLHHEDDPLRVEALYNGTSHGMLVPLDLNINCRIRRQSNRVCLMPDTGSSPSPASPSAAPSFPSSPQEAEKYTGGKLFGEVSHEL